MALNGFRLIFLLPLSIPYTDTLDARCAVVYKCEIFLEWIQSKRSPIVVNFSAIFAKNPSTKRLNLKYTGRVWLYRH